jgi:hypothetical protein
MPRSSKGYKVTLMLPLRDNAGTPIDRDTWDWWHDRLTSLVAGFTDMGVVSGWWRGYTDENRRITIIVRSMREVQAIRRLLRDARLRFRQEAMYLEYHAVSFEEVV